MVSGNSKELYFAYFWAVALVVIFLPDFSLFDYNDNPFNGKPVGGDYLVFWYSGLEASLGRALQLYDPAQFQKNMIEQFGGFGIATWLYPPHILFIFAGLAKLSYALSWLVFTLASVGVYLWTVARLFPSQPRMLLLCSIAPATFICIIQSQTGFLVSSLLVGALFVMPKRPLLAGVLIGLLTIKPQLGILIPFILIFEKRFVTFAVAGITTIAVIGASALWFGIDVWQQYFSAMADGSSAALLKTIAAQPIGTMTTVYGFASALGTPHNLALMAQGATALICIIAAFVVSRSTIDHMSKMATYVLLSYLISPYIMSYDFQAVAIIAAMVICGIGGQKYSLPERLLAIAALILPLIQLASEYLFIPVAVLFLICFTAMMVLRCVRSKQDNQNDLEAMALNP